VNRVVWVPHSMPNCSWVAVYLMIVSPLVCVVTEEVDLFESLALDVTKGVSLVPTVREDVEGDLAANRKSQAIVSKLFLQDLNESRANAVDFVISLEIVAFLYRRVTPDGTDIDHAIAELNKGSSFDREVNVGKVVKNEVDEDLVAILANILDEGLGGQLLAEAVGGQTILGKCEVKIIGDFATMDFQLFSDLDKIGTTDKADNDALPELTEEINHFR